LNEQFEILKSVIERLEGADIAYMLSGSMAMNYYAQPRMTRDIDIVVELMLDDAERVMALFQHDFYLDEEMVHNAIFKQGLFNIIHNDWLVKVDFIVRKNTPYRQEEFLRRQQVNIDGFTAWLVSAEDLLLSKLLWAKDSHSEMQLNDIRNIITSVSQLDWRYINHWAAILSVGELLNEVRQ
jgi:uncharacterized protein YeeX (DUF496 family)